jgi:hypothetical protein
MKELPLIEEALKPLEAEVENCKEATNLTSIPA